MTYQSDTFAVRTHQIDGTAPQAIGLQSCILGTGKGCHLPLEGYLTAVQAVEPPDNVHALLIVKNHGTVVVAAEGHNAEVEFPAVADDVLLGIDDAQRTFAHYQKLIADGCKPQQLVITVEQQHLLLSLMRDHQNASVAVGNVNVIVFQDVDITEIVLLIAEEHLGVQLIVRQVMLHDFSIGTTGKEVIVAKSELYASGCPLVLVPGTLTLAGHHQ